MKSGPVDDFTTTRPSASTSRTFPMMSRGGPQGDRPLGLLNIDSGETDLDVDAPEHPRAPRLFRAARLDLEAFEGRVHRVQDLCDHGAEARGQAGQKPLHRGGTLVPRGVERPPVVPGLHLGDAAAPPPRSGGELLLPNRGRQRSTGPGCRVRHFFDAPWACCRCFCSAALSLKVNPQHLSCAGMDLARGRRQREKRIRSTDSVAAPTF